MKIFDWRILSSQQGIIPLVVMAIVGVVGASGVTVAASQASIPGDVLYPVKKVTENLRVATAFSKEDKAKVHLAIAEEKVKEIEKLEERGKTDKIEEAVQGLEDSQGEALELTQAVKSEAENVDELVVLLEAQSGRQQIVLTRISNNIPEQAKADLIKSLEQFREELKKTIESIKEDEQEEADPTSTPCPSPSASEDEVSDQEDEVSDIQEDRDEDWEYENLKYEDEDVRGISQLRNSRNSNYGNDPCDSAESYSGAGSATFDGGNEAGTVDFSDDTSESPSDQGSSNEAPTSTNPDVEGISTTGGLLQLILNVLFPPQEW